MDISKKHKSVHGRALSERSRERFISTMLMGQYLRVCEVAGIARAQLLDGSGIAEADINPANGWVRREVAERLLRHRLRHWPDPVLGLHMAAVLEPTTAGLVGFMTLSCPSLLDLHNTIRDFSQLVTNAALTTMVHEPGCALWCIDVLAEDEQVLRHGVEWYLAACAALISRQAPRALLAVRIAHAPCLVAGQPHPEYAKHFSCPVFFNQGHSALVLDSHSLNNQSPIADVVVFESLREQAKMLLGQRDSGSGIIDRVRLELRAMLAEGNCSREEIAGRLGMSARHLHRQLQLEDSSYQLILDELRTEIARQRLESPACDVDELSAALCFSGAKSFSRWFLAQTGLTPVAFRRRAH